MSEANAARSSVDPIARVHAGIRLAVELSILAGFGVWGWSLTDHLASRLTLAVVAVVTAAGVWFGTSAEGDVRRFGGPLRVSGRVRLLIELAVFALSSAFVWTAWSRAASETLMTAVLIQNAVTWERIRRLIRDEPREDTCASAHR